MNSSEQTWSIVLDYLRKRNRPLTLGDVCSGLQGIDKVTIRYTLKDLVDSGDVWEERIMGNRTWKALT